MSRLDGKVAIVTGAASGNGRAIALRFAELGADVAIADVDAGFMSGSILFCDAGITSGLYSGAALAAMQGSAR